MGIGARSGGERLRTVWTPEMDRFFIDLMLGEVGKGNKLDDQLFSKSAWKNMASMFNDKFKFQYEKDVLKNRHKTLRNLYRAVKSLLARRGFAWDDTRKMVTAENCVWDEYIKVRLRGVVIERFYVLGCFCLNFFFFFRHTQMLVRSESRAFLIMMICV